MTNYSPSQKLLFIHIPKTAGVSIRDALERNIHDMFAFHNTLEEYSGSWDWTFGVHHTYNMLIENTQEHNIPINWNEYYKFSCVRNPYARLVSLYKHRHRKRNAKTLGKPRLTEEDKRILDKGFKYWLLNTQHIGDKVLTKKPQSDWIMYGNKIICSTVLHVENLDTEWYDLASQFSLPTELPHKNKTQKTDWQDYYDKDTKAHVDTYFEKDLDLFKYKFV